MFAGAENLRLERPEPRARAAVGGGLYHPIADHADAEPAQVLGVRSRFAAAEGLPQRGMRSTHRGWARYNSSDELVEERFGGSEVERVETFREASVSVAQNPAPTAGTSCFSIQVRQTYRCA